MTIKQIEEYIAGGEGLHCEFKEAENQLPRNLMETVCAFLNADGGYVFLGVADDGTITGVNPLAVDKLKSDLVNLVNNPQKIDPPYILFPEEHIVEDKTIIVAQVPVSSQLHKTDGEIYLRSEGGDYRVRGTHHLAGIINRKMGMFSEQRPMPRFSMQDLRPELFERARRLMWAHHTTHPWIELSPEQLLKIAGFYTENPDTGEPCLNLAAILMFGNDLAIQRAAPAYVFDCLLRRDNVERYDDRLQITTNLIDAYDQMMAFVEKHLNDPFYLEKDQRVSLRAKIFSEAISNIISHREYLHGTPGRMMIYRDRVVFANPCTQHYMGKITLDNLEPFARNPVICRFMIQLGRFDRLGSGVRNINHFLPLYANGATPLFEELERGFRLIIPLADQVTEQVTEHVAEHVAEQVMRLLLAIEGEMSRKALMDSIGLKHRPTFIQDYLSPSLEKGFIEMTQPDSPKSPTQKYRLTEKGRGLIEIG